MQDHLAVFVVVVVFQKMLSLIQNVNVLGKKWDASKTIRRMGCELFQSS